MPSQECQLAQPILSAQLLSCSSVPKKEKIALNDLSPATSGVLPSSPGMEPIDPVIVNKTYKHEVHIFKQCW